MPVQAYTINEAADILGITTARVWELVSGGYLKTTKIRATDNLQFVGITRESTDEYISNQEKPVHVRGNLPVAKVQTVRKRWTDTEVSLLQQITRDVVAQYRARYPESHRTDGAIRAKYDRVKQEMETVTPSYPAAQSLYHRIRAGIKHVVKQMKNLEVLPGNSSGQ